MTYERFKEQFHISLNPQQERAVQAVDGHVLLLAVPGSGKTTVLVTRLGYMVYGCGIAPGSILTMTYTVSAARDMRSRFAALFGDELAQQLEFRTINGVSARIIRTYEQLYDRRAFQVLSDEKEVLALIREIYKKVCSDYPMDSDIKSVRTGIAYVKNQMLTAEEIAAMDKDIKGFSEMYRLYNNALKSRGLMDYDDQMVYALKILQQYPLVLERFRSRCRYLCVDEAQDTSKIQHCIIQLLADGNLFMVGDEDQSIYGFRAAYPEALLEFEHTYPDALVLLMETNYRSTQSIVAAADRFIQKNKNRHPKSMTAVRERGKAVREIPVPNRKQQYRYLLKVAQGCERETAVLYRDNDCALPLIDLLERENIPYQCRKMDIGFFSHKLTRDMTDIIRLSQNQTDSEAFLRVYYKFSAGITKKAALAAVEHSRGEYPLMALLSEDMSLSEWTRTKCKGLYTHLLSMQNERADKAIYRIVHFMGYGDYLEDSGGDMSRIGILTALGEQEPNPCRLLERLEELQEIIQYSKQLEDCPFILSTIHSAKGLEYETVYLMDVIDGILPKRGDDIDEDEERRLFYVGVTRAKDELAVFSSQDEKWPSSFADELFGRERKKSVPLEQKVQIEKKMSSPIQAPRRAIFATDGFHAGTRVKHRTYGIGKITNRQGDFVDIQFESGKCARFSLSAGLKSKAIEAI
ncbi:MAG: ATP-dependent helicase [Oscillospiraceae bacterium]|nr:ATP-dependent helicase [Oscillospiraceae bacterium]